MNERGFLRYFRLGSKDNRFSMPGDLQMIG